MARFRETVVIPVLNFPGLGGAASVIIEYWKSLRKKYNVCFLTTPMVDPKGMYPIAHLSRSVIFPHPHVFFFIIPYVIAGFVRLVILCLTSRVKFILSQDGLFTGLYCVLAGIITRTKVYIMDYGASVNISREEYCFSQSSRFRTIARVSLGFYRANMKLEMLLAKWLIPFVARNATKILVTGKDLEELYSRIGLPDQMRIRYNVPIDPEEFLVAPDDIQKLKSYLNGITNGAIDKSNVIVYHAGRLAPEKGFETLIPVLRNKEVREAFARNEAIILIAGDGPIRSSIERAVDGFDYVHMIGNLAQKQIVALSKIADIFLYTASQGGTLSRGVLEAMAGECHVIATDSPMSHLETLGEGRGKCIPTKDVNSLQIAIIEALNDKEYRKASGNLAREYVISRHSIEEIERVLHGL